MRIKKILYFLLTVFLILQVQCTIPTPSDVVPPVVLIVYPYSGAVIAGNSTVVVESGDNREINSVWWYLDGEFMGRSSSRAPRFEVDVSSYADEQTHIIVAAANDKDGNIGYSAPVSVIISDSEDNIPPVVQIIHPQSGQTVEDTVHVVAAAFDERIVREVAFFVNGDSVITDSVYPYEYFWPVGNLEDSTNHTIVAKAWDEGNNWALSNPVTVVVFPRVDRLPPTAQLIYPVPGQVLFDTVEVIVEAQDDHAVTRVDFYVDGDSVTSVTKAPYIFNWDTNPIADNGQHTLYFKAIDAAGNQSINTPITFTVSATGSADITPPTGEITYPLTGSSIFDQVTIYVNADDDVGVTRVDFYVDGEFKFSDTQAPWAFDWDTTPYADGFQHSVLAKIYDAAGNVGNAALATYTVESTLPDVTPPTAQILYPLAGSTLSGVQTIFVDANDDVGVVQAEFYVDGEFMFNDTSEPWTYDWDTAPYADGGLHSVYVKVFDDAGNVGTTGNVTYTVSGPPVDITPPTITLLYPLPGTTITGIVNVSASAQDDTGVTKVEFYVDGALKSTDNSAPWGFVWDTSPLADGAQHSLYLIAYDAAGNTGTQGPVTFIIN